MYLHIRQISGLIGYTAYYGKQADNIRLAEKSLDGGFVQKIYLSCIRRVIQVRPA